MRLQALALAALFASSLPGQEALVTPAAYRADFVIQDAGDTAAKGGRRFSMVLDASGKGSLRSGTRVPYQTGPQQWQYMEIGVNIDCRVRSIGAKLGVGADLDISTFLPAKPGESAGGQPTTSQLRLSTNAVLTPGKPATIAAVDDPTTGRRISIDATVTKQE